MPSAARPGQHAPCYRAVTPPCCTRYALQATITVSPACSCTQCHLACRSAHGTVACSCGAGALGAARRQQAEQRRHHRPHTVSHLALSHLALSRLALSHLALATTSRRSGWNRARLDLKCFPSFQVLTGPVSPLRYVNTSTLTMQQSFSVDIAYQAGPC